MFRSSPSASFTPLRQRTRVQQLDVRKELSQQQRQSGSEQLVIIDDQYAHFIVPQDRFRGELQLHSRRCYIRSSRPLCSTRIVHAGPLRHGQWRLTHVALPQKWRSSPVTRHPPPDLMGERPEDLERSRLGRARAGGRPGSTSAKCGPIDDVASRGPRPETTIRPPMMHVASPRLFPTFGQ
jgi:hypothetical protein